MRVVVGLTLLGLASGALADPTYLAGGALIAHYVADLALSEPPPEGVCAAYAPYAMTQPADQINRIDTASYQIADWFIIAAWIGEDRQFCGVQFGFSDYDPGIFRFTYFDACFPPTGGLTIPSVNWPGPNEGVAFVVTGDPWLGNWLPVYWFIGYAYGYGDPGVIQLIPDPTVAEPFGGMGNCTSPPEKWDAQLGGMGINMDGTYVEPYPAHPPGVCCIGTDCLWILEGECLAAGGTWMPGEECEPVNPCDPIWACCIFGECTMATASLCEAAGRSVPSRMGFVRTKPLPAGFADRAYELGQDQGPVSVMRRSHHRLGGVPGC